MISFGDILRKNRGLGPGFDFARIFLALSVLGVHSPELSYGNAIDTRHTPIFWIYFLAILPMFFGLSGFLVAGSAQRLSLKNFFINRGFRIVPALSVEIVLSALVLGPLLSVYSLRDYFHSVKFYTYFANIVGLIHFKLPGLFLDNPYPDMVNGSLWTVPHELICYVVMAIIIKKRWADSVPALLGLAATAIGFSFLFDLFYRAAPHWVLLDDLYSRYNQVGLGPVLLPCFLLGVASYSLRDRIRYDWRIFLGCVLFLTLFGYVAPPDIWKVSSIAFLVCPAMIYIVVFVGLTTIPRIPLYSTGDYSYGIYLYAFPIQQSLVYLFPAMRNGLVLGIASLVVSTLFAMFSWHFIEKPLLKLRKGFSFASRLEHARHADDVANAGTADEGSKLAKDVSRA